MVLRKDLNIGHLEPEQREKLIKLLIDMNILNSPKPQSKTDDEKIILQLILLDHAFLLNCIYITTNP